MIELGIASGPPVERHGYTSMYTAAAEAYAEHGLYGAMVGAVEIAAAMFARAFAGASVEPAVPALSPAVLADVARRLITSGESCHLIEVDAGAIRLAECSAWSVVAGGPRPETWRYQCETPGPHTTETRTVPGDQVVHVRYATNAAEPWRGLAPLTLAGTTGRLAVNLERALRDEAGGPVGSLIPMPVDTGGDDAAAKGDDDDVFGPLKRQINRLAGKVGLVETTTAGYGEGRAAGPRDDWKPRRIGAHPPDSLGTLRQAVEATVLSTCGIPPGLARAEGGESRESYRRWYAASVLPLAALVQSELRHKLDVPALRLDFASLAAADVHGRARAWRSLVGRDVTMPDADARAIVGL